ncbi:MAG: hypothetical protein BWY74_01071 [Firmicutes bacterium ADurb.Bin419]|nr:MAG: hypothetical protein BWY74_01071 [Firmicutes bacterium ADurb.Bin419]
MKEGLTPFVAASAAFIFAIVAICIPILPARADKTVPKTYETAIKIFSEIFPVLQIGFGSRITISTAAIAVNRAKTRYSRFRKVLAP